MSINDEIEDVAGGTPATTTGTPATTTGTPATTTRTPTTTTESPTATLLVKNVDYYLENGFYVFTATYLKKRGYCCGSGCRHCPY